MIVISNGKDSIKINNDDLIFENNKYKLFGNDISKDIILTFIKNKKGFVKIQKRLQSAEHYDGDVLKEYINKDVSNNKILLDNDDYQEILRYFVNIKKDESIRKNVIINSFSNLIAYECYRWYLFDILEEFDINYIYNSICRCNYIYERHKYKTEIIKKVKIRLKNNYNINLDNLINN